MDDINWTIFPDQFAYFVTNIRDIRNLNFPNTFSEYLNTFINLHQDFTMAYDQGQNLLCPIKRALIPKKQNLTPTPLGNPREGLVLVNPMGSNPATDSSNLDLTGSDSNLDTASDDEFYKFNLTDFILALTSLVVTVIAVSNSVYLIYNNKCKVRLDNLEIGDEQKEDEPKPSQVKIHSILKNSNVKKLDKKVEFVDQPKQKTFWNKLTRTTSTLSLPSPKPARKLSV
jgi:hypothetical protein